MFGLKKKKQLRFFCTVPELKNIYPVAPTKTVRREWMTRAATRWKEQQQEEDFGSKRIGTIVKCPGINKIHRTGWTLFAWQDIHVKADYATDTYEIMTPAKQEEFASRLKQGRYVKFHPPGQFSDFIDLKPHTMRTLLKIDSPWYADIPEGYELVCLPVPYPDDNQFTTAIGILDGDNGPVPMNVQLFWHIINSTGTIKAGTPIAQYILVPKEHPEVEVSIGAMTDEDFNRVRHTKMLTFNTFISNMKQRANLWKKYQKTEK